MQAVHRGVSVQGQFTSGKVLQNSDRRFLRRDQRVFRDDERFARARTDRKRTAWLTMSVKTSQVERGGNSQRVRTEVRLEFFVFFEEVMEAKHPMVIGRASEAAQA